MVNAATTINGILTQIESAFDNTVSRDGSAPNAMNASLDMNSNTINNLPDPVSNHQPVTLSYFNSHAVAGPTGPSGANQTVSTVAGLTASFDVGTKVVTVQGYYTPGVGGFKVRRTNSEPTHLWKFRSADRYLMDGTTHATNGGWWEGYPEDGINLYAEQFGVKADYDEFNNAIVTDDYASYAVIIDYIKKTSLLYETGYSPVGLTVNLARGSSYCSQTLEFENIVTIKGMAGINGDFGVQPSKIIFPINKNGLIFYHYYSDPLSDKYDASGSVLQGFTVQSAPYGNFGTGSGWDGVIRAGITSHAALRVESVAVIGWGGHGFISYGKKGSRVDALSGSGDSQVFINLECSSNARDGLRLQGSDANGCTVIGTISSDNGSWGINENSQLGNTHIQHTLTGNGNPGDPKKWNLCCLVQEGGNQYLPYPEKNTTDGFTAADLAISRPSTNPSLWYLAKTTAATGFVEWGQCKHNNVVYTAVPGQEANMWITEPGTDAGVVWTAGGAPTVGWYYITWKLNWQPYICGGDVGALSEVGCSTFINCYHEPIYSPDFPPSYYSSSTYAFGAQAVAYTAPNSLGPVMRANGGLEFLETSIRSTKTAYTTGPVWSATLTTVKSYLGGDGANGPIQSWDINGSLYALHLDDVTLAGGDDMRFDYNASQVYYYILGASTTRQFGRASPAPYFLWYNNGFMMGPNDSRWFNGGHIAPNSGEHAAGDLVWNTQTTEVGDFWRCTATGNPGTWKKQYLSDVPVYAPCAVADLPAGTEGARGSVTDANSTTFLAAAAAGGANKVPVVYLNGGWKIG